MNLNRIFAYLMACIIFISSILIYFEYIYKLGFPDHYITELGSAERRLASSVITINSVVGSIFIYLGIRAPRKQLGKQLSITTICYLIFIIGVYLVDYYYRAHLDNGGGG